MLIEKMTSNRNIFCGTLSRKYVFLTEKYLIYLVRLQHSLILKKNEQQYLHSLLHSQTLIAPEMFTMKSSVITMMIILYYAPGDLLLSTDCKGSTKGMDCKFDP